MLKTRVLIMSSIFSVLCLVVPAYHDYHTGWQRTEYAATVALFFAIFIALFYYIHRNFQSIVPFRKYVLTSVILLIIAILTSAGFVQTADIPTLGAMLIYLLMCLPIIAILELIDYFLQSKKII